MPESTSLVNEENMGREDGLSENESAQKRAQERAGRSATPVFQSVITNLHPESGILATAEVKVGNICTIRNVKVKENDYGKEVVMPRTKMPYNAGYKDACFFESREVREQFDQSVLQAYELQMHQGYVVGSEYEIELEQDEMDLEMDQGLDQGLDEGDGPEMGF